MPNVVEKILCGSCVGQFAWTLGQLRHREVLCNGSGVKGEVIFFSRD